MPQDEVTWLDIAKAAHLIAGFTTGHFLENSAIKPIIAIMSFFAIAQNDMKCSDCYQR